MCKDYGLCHSHFGTGVCSAVDGYLNVTKYDSTYPANLWLNIYVTSAGPMGG